MTLSTSHEPTPSPVRRTSRPVPLYGHFLGDERELLLTLRKRLPACGAWVGDCRRGAKSAVELRFEVLVRSAWQLYTLLLSLGLELSPASHRELCTFCVICQNRSALTPGAVVEMVLALSPGAPPRGGEGGAKGSQA